MLAPPGVVMVASAEVPRNAEGRKAKAAPKAKNVGYIENSAARDSIKAGVLHLASLQRALLSPRGLLQRCYISAYSG